MKYYELDLKTVPLADLEFETFCTNNIVELIDEGNHIPFIKQQTLRKNYWLAEGRKDWHDAITSRLDLFLQVCVEKGIDVSQFLPSEEQPEE